jgi:oxazoline/thiazoline dehydrogenase
MRIDGEHGEVESRPYPSGGGIHELEFFLFVERCEGITPGVYRYRALEHDLERLTIPLSHAAVLLDGASYASLLGRRPDLLIVMAADFQRLSWKYESIAYSLVLKHVGCVLQTMYLVATELKLSPCAIGSGDSRLFAEALGVDAHFYPAVGEFMLNGRAPA